MLRPLTKDGARRKKDSELNQGEKATLRDQKQKAAFLKRNPHLRGKIK